MSPRRRTAGSTAAFGAPTRARRLMAIGAALLAVSGVGVAGSLLPAETATVRVSGAPLVGQTSSVCTVLPRATTGDEPAPAGPDTAAGTDTVAAVAVRSAPGRTGALVGSPLGGGTSLLTVKDQGRGEEISRPDGPVTLTGEGVMATSSAGAVLSVATEGATTGVMAAPCTPPATSHWFVGVGASDAHRTELVLSNPDDAQAEVDLRFFGRTGPVVVPGSPNLVVGGGENRTVNLAPLVAVEGPLTVWVRANSGRVSAMARDLFSAALQPAGADWHPTALAPGQEVVVPAVPEGTGRRDLLVVNPNRTRATVTVSVLGIQGAYSPTGAETIDVAPESTASVSLEQGLAGQSGAVQLTSDQPVTATVLAGNRPTQQRPDVAVQPAAGPVNRVGASAIATTDAGEVELIMSNAGDTDTPVTFEVFSLDGVVLRAEDVVIGARGTATRRLNSPAPSYLVLRVPDGSAIHAGLTLASVEGPVAGLANLTVVSPDMASRAPEVRADPAVGR